MTLVDFQLFEVIGNNFSVVVLLLLKNILANNCCREVVEALATVEWKCGDISWALSIY